MKSESGELGGATGEKQGGTANETKKTFDWSGAAPDGVVCPACFGELRGDSLSGAETLVCSACGRRFPVVDGIPVLIIERAG
jgi:hypothetical protein